VSALAESNELSSFEQFDFDAEPEFIQLDSEADVEADAEAEAEVDVDADADAETEVDAEADAEAEAEAEVDTETESEESKPNSYPDLIKPYDGCGVGWASAFTPGAESKMKNACSDLNLCYAKCGTSKMTCDDKFLKAMKLTCAYALKNDSLIRRKLCEAQALLYYQAVDKLNGAAWTAGQTKGKCIKPDEAKLAKEREKKRKEIENSLRRN
jgi:hypothetical protein